MIYKIVEILERIRMIRFVKKFYDENKLSFIER